MPDDLDDMLDKYDTGQAGLKERRAEAEMQAKIVQEQSKTLVDEHIAPVLNDVASRLKERGHTSFADIAETSGTISLIPKGTSSAERPRLQFTVGKDVVNMNGSNILSGRGGSSGPRGSFPVDELSQDKVREVTMGWVREVLEGPWVNA
jgi:hypothetical protein